MRSRKNCDWTVEDDAVLREMTAEDKSVFLIAAKLGRTFASVRRRGAEIGITVQSRRETKKRAREAVVGDRGFGTAHRSISAARVMNEERRQAEE